MKVLRVTADDFGLTAGVTRGVVHCHVHGVVTHTSLMAGGLDFAGAVAVAREYPDLGVGVHLTLTWGHPLAPAHEVPSLLGPDGRFWPLGTLVARLASGRVRLAEVEREWRAQLERVVGSLGAISHLDSHHHVHVLPGVLPVAGRLAREWGAPWLRRPREARPAFASPLGRQIKRTLLATLCRQTWPGVHGQGFHGLCLYDRPDFPQALAAQLARLPEGHHELMVHPGWCDPELCQQDEYQQRRELELSALCDPALPALLDRAGVVLDRHQGGRARRSRWDDAADRSPLHTIQAG